MWGGGVVELLGECAMRGGEGGSGGGRVGGGGTSSKCKGRYFRVRCSIEKTVDSEKTSSRKKTYFLCLCSVLHFSFFCLQVRLLLLTVSCSFLFLLVCVSFCLFV